MSTREKRHAKQTNSAPSLYERRIERKTKYEAIRKDFYFF